MYTLVDEQEESFVGNTTVWLVLCWWCGERTMLMVK